MAKNAIHRWLRCFWVRPHLKLARSPQSAARWIAAIAYTVLALGIPLPVPMGKAGKEAYPCMNHHCGCQSAEQCWRNCCCMTLEERLFWRGRITLGRQIMPWRRRVPKEFSGRCIGLAMKISTTWNGFAVNKRRSINAAAADIAVQKRRLPSSSLVRASF